MGELHVDVPPVQQQRGATDCGLFGIAFASELAKGENFPKDITFNQSRMRSHLLQCFENDEIMPFPRQHKPSKRKRGYELEVIRTFCTCNLHEAYDDMVQCDICAERLHFDCMDLITAPTGAWLCPACEPPKKLKR